MNNIIQKNFVFMLFCVFTIVNVYAQEVYDLQGVVKNQDGQPIENVNISFIDFNNNIIQKTNTSADGTFLLQVPDLFPQIVEMRHVSYNTYTVYLSDKKHLALLKNIILENKSTELDEVQVTGSKPKMYFRDEALVVNISNNSNFQHQPLTMVLRKMPGTEIDNKSNITLYGKEVINQKRLSRWFSVNFQSRRKVLYGHQMQWRTKWRVHLYEGQVHFKCRHILRIRLRA